MEFVMELLVFISIMLIIAVGLYWAFSGGSVDEKYGAQYTHYITYKKDIRKLVRAMFYNRRLFEKYGLKIKRDYDCLENKEDIIFILGTIELTIVFSSGSYSNNLLDFFSTRYFEWFSLKVDGKKIEDEGIIEKAKRAVFSKEIIQLGIKIVEDEIAEKEKEIEEKNKIALEKIDNISKINYNKRK